MTIQQRQQGKHTAARVIGRALAGRPLNGVRRTDSTFLHPATVDLTEHGRSAHWHWRPGWHRALARVLGVTGTAGGAYGYLEHRLAFFVILGALATGSLVFAVYRFRRALVTWTHHRHVVYPLWHVLANMTGYPVSNPGVYQSVPVQKAGHHKHHHRERPEKFLHIPRDFADNEKAVIRWEPPFTWEGNITQQKTITGIIERKLGGDWSADWHMHHDPKNPGPRFLLMRHAPQPPARIMLDDFRAQLDAAPENVLRLGMGTGEALADINLDSESPHVAISMGTGGGKSDTLAGIIASLVRKGCERIDIIDPKKVSHSWAQGLPGVHIHKYVAAQMEAIHNARLLMDSRYDALDTDETISFARHVLIIEEQNSLMEDLKEFWEDYRAGLSPKERQTVPKRNPAIKDLRYILNKGRQCRINVISVYQRMSADAAGGGDARENYGAKILARYSPQTWKILVGTPYIRPSRIPGRGMLVLGEDSHAIQRVYAGIADSSGKPSAEGIARLREYALNGRADSRSPVGGTPVSAGAAEELVSLREAAESGVVSIRYGALLKARQRDRGFPPGVKRGNVTLYRPAELQGWLGNRGQARAA
jgi:hypothetical protein